MIKFPRFKTWRGWVVLFDSMLRDTRELCYPIEGTICTKKELVEYLHRYKIRVNINLTRKENHVYLWSHKTECWARVLVPKIKEILADPFSFYNQATAPSMMNEQGISEVGKPALLALKGIFDELPE